MIILIGMPLNRTFSVSRPFPAAALYTRNTQHIELLIVKLRKGKFFINRYKLYGLCVLYLYYYITLFICYIPSYSYIMHITR